MRGSCALYVSLLLCACDGTVSRAGSDFGDFGGLSAIVPPPASLSRLRSWEYRNSLVDLLELPAGTTLELRSDLVRAQFTSVSAAIDCYDDIDLETRELIALDVASQAFALSPTPLDRFGCTPTSATDACVGDFVATFAGQAWRRPPSAEERDTYRALAVSLAEIYGDDSVKGVELAVAAMLTSPNFLYRVELGEPDSSVPEYRRYSSLEMASRLSFVLWGTTPDDELLALAESGALTSEEGVRAEARRMLNDPRAAEEMHRVWREHLNVDRLTIMSYPKSGATEALYASMRAEASALIDRVIAPGVDARTFLTSEEATLGAEVAELYGLDPGANMSLPPSRRGFLTTGLFLATHSHPGKNSPVRRGKFVLERILCQTVPPPPPDLDIELPDVPTEQVTLREQLSVHSQVAACAGCHSEMDPLGFSFEGFDMLGAERDLDNGLPIDSSGEFRGAAFSDARGVIDIIATYPEVGRCLVEQSLRAYTGHIETGQQYAYINSLNEAFVKSGYDYRTLVEEIVVSEVFRHAYGTVGAVDANGETNE
ncbi:MAG: DUF1588 domain-containing protein [Myxococcota bacterium]